MSDMPLEWKIGQMLMVGVEGTTLTDDARRLIDDLHVGSVLLMAPNVESPAQVAALTHDLQALARAAGGRDLLIATDQEGGRVQRLRPGFTPLPPAATVGACGRPDLIRAYGRAVGAELRAVGVNLDLAPVLDVNDNPRNPVIGDRAFGTEAATVEAAAAAFLAGLHDAGVAATGKHFPGHGNTSADSHYALPVVLKDRAALDQTELRPFRAAVGAGVDAIMVAHVVFPALDPAARPATVSHAIITGLLREAWGFDGVIVTDDMGMAGIASVGSPAEAAVQAVLAGADVLVCSRLDPDRAPDPDPLRALRAGLLQAVDDGRLPLECVDAAVRRVEALKARYAAAAAAAGLAQVGSPEHQRVVAAVI